MLRILIITSSILILNGCAFIHAMDSEIPQKIDQWRTENEYAKALNTLEYISKSHKNYVILMKKKNIILKEVKEFENKNHKQAQIAENNIKWNKAAIIYEKALDKLPKTSPLTIEYQNFIKRRNNYLEELEFKLSINKAKWLIESMPIQKKLVFANPADSKVQNRYEDTLEDIEKNTKELINCIEVTMQAKKTLLAETCFQIVDKFDDAYFDKSMLKKFKTQLSKKQHQQQTIHDNKTKTLIDELKQGYSHDNLLRAQRHLSILENNIKPNQHTATLTAQLSDLFKKGLANRMQSGQRLYSDGKIENALSIWMPLQKIVPENKKLDNYIKRAQRVLAKVKKLSTQPATVNLP